VSKIKLNTDLEQSLLKAISLGLTSPSTLDPKEISKVGRAVLRASAHLINNGATTPLKLSAIYITSKKIFGKDSKEITKYLRQVEKIDLGDDASAVIQTLKDKDALVQIVNEAGTQLKEGAPNFLRFQTMLSERESDGTGRRIKSLSDQVGEKWPPPPCGPSIKSLPQVSKASNGICGIWALGGDPGVGKSTLAWQLALEMNDHMDVLYYDLDGTGTDWFIERGKHIYESTKRFKKHTDRIFVRNGIASLDTDLMRIGAPALIIIDSLQTLPTNLSHRRSSLDKWLVDFKSIHKRGFTFILVSEVGRNSYGEPGLDSFKETGEIEYACSFGCILTGDPEEEDEPIEFTIVKNRHSKKKGHLLDLERDEKKTFWFNES